MLEIGMKHSVETMVTEENTAAKAGSGFFYGFRNPLYGCINGKRCTHFDGCNFARR